MNKNDKESMRKWLNEDLPIAADNLEQSILKGYADKNNYNMGLAGRNHIYNILDYLLAVLFPVAYVKHRPSKEELNSFLTETLRYISVNFLKHLTDAFAMKYPDDGILNEDKARDALMDLIQSLPAIREALLADIETAYNGDPAASSIDEIILSYPFLDALATHRLAHTLYKKDVPVIPRIMSERAHMRTGIDIHPGAVIQPGFFIDHGTGVVIGETSRIGKNVKIYQGVTLGALSPFDKDGAPLRGQKRHPDIEDDVIIYANATILGGNTVIGKGAIIGGNCWVTRSIPAGAIVYNQNEVKIK